MSKWVDRKPPPTPEEAANIEKGLWRDGRMPGRVCSATNSTNGKPCRRAPIQGANVCRVHGGAAGHVKRAAKARLENASYALAKELLGMATDEDTPPAVRLAAIKDALDRAGLNPRQAMDVQHSLKKYEQVLEGIDRDSLGPAAPAVVDGEINTDFTDFGDGREA